MVRRIIGLVAALAMIVLGSVWTAQANGWIGDAEPSRAFATLGALLAGLGVALAIVALQKRH